MKNSKKILTSIFMFLLVMAVIINVNSISFSTIQMIGDKVGLQMPADLGNLLTQTQCVINVVNCVTSQISGKIMGEAFNALPPELRKTINTYNQIKGYTEKVAGIIGELQVNSDTGSLSGCVKTQDQFKNICTQNANLLFDEETKITTYEFKEKESSLSFETKTGTETTKNEFTNIKPKNEQTKTEAYVQVDEKGKILKADLTTNEKGSIFIFNDKEVKVPPNTKVEYKDGNIVMHAEDRKNLNFELKNTGEKTPKKYTVSGGAAIWTGRGLELLPGAEVVDNDLKFSVENKGSNVIFLTDSNNKIGTHTNWIVANSEKIEFDTQDTILNFYEGNKWLPSVDSGDAFNLQIIKGSGNIKYDPLFLKSKFEYNILDKKGEITQTNCGKTLSLSKDRMTDNNVNMNPCVSLSITNLETGASISLYEKGDEYNNYVSISNCKPGLEYGSTGETIIDITGKFQQPGVAKYTCELTYSDEPIILNKKVEGIISKSMKIGDYKVDLSEEKIAPSTICRLERKEEDVRSTCFKITIKDITGDGDVDDILIFPKTGEIAVLTGETPKVPQVIDMLSRKELGYLNIPKQYMPDETYLDMLMVNFKNVAQKDKDTSINFYAKGVNNNELKKHLIKAYSNSGEWVEIFDNTVESGDSFNIKYNGKEFITCWMTSNAYQQTKSEGCNK